MIAKIIVNGIITRSAVYNDIIAIIFNYIVTFAAIYYGISSVIVIVTGRLKMTVFNGIIAAKCVNRNICAFIRNTISISRSRDNGVTRTVAYICKTLNIKISHNHNKPSFQNFLTILIFLSRKCSFIFDSKFYFDNQLDKIARLKQKFRLAH